MNLNNSLHITSDFRPINLCSLLKIGCSLSDAATSHSELRFLSFICCRFFSTVKLFLENSINKRHFIYVVQNMVTIMIRNILKTSVLTVSFDDILRALSIDILVCSLIDLTESSSLESSKTKCKMRPSALMEI